MYCILFSWSAFPSDTSIINDCQMIPVLFWNILILSFHMGRIKYYNSILKWTLHILIPYFLDIYINSYVTLAIKNSLYFRYCRHYSRLFLSVNFSMNMFTKYPKPTTASLPRELISQFSMAVIIILNTFFLIQKSAFSWKCTACKSQRNKWTPMTRIYRP